MGRDVMPVYEYECDTCKKTFEVRQSMADKPLADCPDCGQPVRKIISRSSFSLKGGGWYSDGYASSSGSASTSKAASADSTPPCQGGSGTCSHCPASSWCLCVRKERRCTLIAIALQRRSSPLACLPCFFCLVHAQVPTTTPWKSLVCTNVTL